MKLSGKTISFNVLENSEIETGHRFDTIVISYKNERIGAICVTQARKPISTKRLVWALSNAMYRNKALCNSGMSGLEVTKAIYNLSKTTNGKDSYKNYPAFAYCIEMNHDPENNMEWHLPSENEIRAYAKGQSYKVRHYTNTTIGGVRQKIALTETHTITFREYSINWSCKQRRRLVGNSV